MKKLLIFLVLLIALGLPFSHAQAISLVDNVACISDGNCTPCDLLTVAFNFAKFIFVSMAALVLLFILWQSLFLVLNMGNAETVKTAKDKIKNTLIAALIILGAYSMVAFAINVYSGNMPGSKSTGWWAKGWWTGPTCESGVRPQTIQVTGGVTTGCGHDIGVPCSCSEDKGGNGNIGCDCGGITNIAEEWQCDDATIKLEQLLSCFSREAAKNSQVSSYPLLITSISDGAGLNKCRNNWNDPDCAHMKGSCHYGGPSGNGNGNGSYAADFHIGVSEREWLGNFKSTFKKITEQCGGKLLDYLDEGSSVPHFHISRGCSGT